MAILQLIELFIQIAVSIIVGIVVALPLIFLFSLFNKWRIRKNIPKNMDEIIKKEVEEHGKRISSLQKASKGSEGVTKGGSDGGIRGDVGFWRRTESADTFVGRPEERQREPPAIAPKGTNEIRGGVQDLSFDNDGRNKPNIKRNWASFE